MEIELPSGMLGLADAVLVDLDSLNAHEVDAFGEIVKDYLASLQINHELRVRNGQLDKEASELRDENVQLLRDTEQLRSDVAESTKAVEAGEKVQELQLELSDLYKRHSKQSEEFLQASRQLQVVRDSHSATSRELEDGQGQVRSLKEAVAELREQVDGARESHALAIQEFDSRLADKEAAEREAARLTADNHQLASRLVEMKEGEMQRMEDTNRMCEQMISNAKGMERTAAAQAAATGTRLALSAAQGARGFMNLLSKGSRSSQDGATSSAADGAEQIPAITALHAIVPTSLLRTLPAHTGGCFAMAWDRGGTRLASCGGDKTVKLWDSTGHHTNTLHGMLEGVLDVSWTCDQSAVLGAGNDKSIRVWDPLTGRARHTMTGHTGKVLCVECSPMESQKAISSGVDRCIKIWDLSRGFCKNSIMCASSCHSLTLTLDGALIASGHFDGSLRFWDLRTGRLAREIKQLHQQQICSVAGGLLGSTMLTCGKDNVLKVLDLRTFEERAALRAPGFAVGAVWSNACLGPDERHAAAGSFDGTVFVWELATSRVVATLKDKDQPVLGCAWSPQGTPLVSCDNRGDLSFWQGTDA